MRFYRFVGNSYPQFLYINLNISSNDLAKYSMTRSICRLFVTAQLLVYMICSMDNSDSHGNFCAFPQIVEEIWRVSGSGVIRFMTDLRVA